MNMTVNVLRAAKSHILCASVPSSAYFEVAYGKVSSSRGAGVHTSQRPAEEGDRSAC